MVDTNDTITVPQSDTSVELKPTSNTTADSNDDVTNLETAAEVVDEPEMSEYEKRRLEKIKRNQALLASLGLSNGTGMLTNTGANPKKRQRKKRSSIGTAAATGDEQQQDENQRVSARKKKSISYKEKSLRAMILETVGDNGVADFSGMSKRKKRNRDNEEKARQRERREEQKPLKIHARPENVIMNEYDREVPMSYGVNNEYWRMARERKRARQVAERNVKSAELEKRIINNSMQREKMKQEMQQKKLTMDYASQIRTEILRLRASKLEKERRKASEISRRNASVANIRERFRKSVRDIEKKLHAQLVAALSDGKSIIRKYREEQRRLKKQQREQEAVALAENNGQSHTLSTEGEVNDVESEQKPKIRKRFTATKIILIDDDEVDDDARQVGGPISVEFSKKVQRSWVMEDTVTALDDVKSFVPQVGDTVM